MRRIKKNWMRQDKCWSIGFDFMEIAFGNSQEMTVFVTELNTNFYSVQFLQIMSASVIINITRICYLMRREEIY